jgi:death-on-curing family protein
MTHKKDEQNQIAIYQTPNGAVEVKLDQSKETIMLTQQQVGQLFNVQKAAISKHINNIFKTKELEKKSTVSILETVQIEGKRKIIRKIEYYNLDLILSVGYRINSINATKFRQWTTKILRSHILEGYTINKSRISKNYETFLKTVEEVKQLLTKKSEIKTENILELIKMFASTWLSLQAYDKSELPKNGSTKKQVKITSEQIFETLIKFKNELISKKTAGELFGIEKEKGSVTGIIGDVFQTFNNQDLYPTIEEKAAHLLYFIVKNHPFVDGNKRSGALAFIWFLNKANILNTQKLSPIALTALTLLVAESNPKDKERIIKLILLLLKR